MNPLRFGEAESERTAKLPGLGNVGAPQSSRQSKGTPRENLQVLNVLSAPLFPARSGWLPLQCLDLLERLTFSGDPFTLFFSPSRNQKGNTTPLGGPRLTHTPLHAPARRAAPRKCPVLRASVSCTLQESCTSDGK